MLRRPAAKVSSGDLPHHFRRAYAMTMAAPSKAWTREEVLALQDAAPDGVRYELIDGELLVSPSPNDPHQRCIAFLLFVLYGYVKQHRIGAAIPSPADISLDRRSILQPDIFVVP